MPFTLRTIGPARRIKRFMLKMRGRRLIARAGRKARYIRRTIGVGNPSPTFVETYQPPQAVIAANAGGVFSVRISDIPQFAQYTNLYKQYRINWVKVILVPTWNYDGGDPNAGLYNAVAGAGSQAMARIAFAINDSPQTVVPANETDVLTDNGCKIQTLRNKWSCSFKPVPDVAMVGAAAGNPPIWARQKYRQWFNFAEGPLVGNNPLHYGVSYFITQSLNAPAPPGQFNVYYKVNFSLRDPQ